MTLQEGRLEINKLPYVNWFNLRNVDGVIYFEGGFGFSLPEATADNLRTVADIMDKVKEA